MLEKIKAAAETVKQYILWILGPLLFLGASFFYLFSKNAALRDKVATLESDKEIQKVQDQIKEADDAAKKADSDYRSVRDAYKREHSDES